MFGAEAVLVAEDAETVREPVRTVLEDPGYRVFAFGNGRKAVETFRGQRGAHDVLLFHVIMREKERHGCL